MSRSSGNMKLPQLLLVLVAITGALSLPPQPRREKDGPKCGYESCHPTKDGFINVHIVPHTHDDVGWLKTVDQYYFGSRSTIQKAGVQYILDSVIDELKQNPARRFIYVETAFLWKWWKKQHDVIKHQFKKYIQNGQLEIIGGAWSMNDEAVTHYHSIIDQFTWGLRRLNDTFGKCGRPKIGWQIDPFGHSREMASIFAQLGYDGLLLGRIDYQDKQFRFQSKTPEMIWQGSQNLGNQSQLFTSVMYNTYSPPAGFCFDILCSDDPIIDDKKSPEYNVDKKLPESTGAPPSIYQPFHQKDYVIEVERTEVIRFDKAWISQCRMQTFKFNRTYSAVNLTLNIIRDLPGDLMGKVQTFKFQSNEYREFPLGFDINICKGLDSNAFGVQNIFKCGNFSTCPLRKRNYHLCNWGPDYSRFPPFIPTGRYKIILTFFLNSKEWSYAEGYIAVLNGILVNLRRNISTSCFRRDASL